ncbi:MAG: tRNA lysidine(34) synthetase TilS [Bacteroidota bacterium]
MLAPFIHQLRNSCNILPGDTILLACSGGLDSMTLAFLLKQSHQPFAIAHCNFTLRGEESDADQQLVEQWCLENNITCFIRRFATEQLKAELGGSTQMLARTLRYEWFNGLMEEHGFTALATAHHLDDSIETFFINLSRGTGLSGLTGIAPRTERIIRPLSAFTRSALTEFAEKNGVSWREDQSNQSDHYLRNRIRHHLVPFFEQENPAWKTGMADTLAHLRSSQETLDQYYDQLRKNAETIPGTFTLSALPSSAVLSGFLHHCFHPMGFTTSQLMNLQEVIQRNDEKKFHSDSCELVYSRGKIVVRDAQPPAQNLVFEHWQDLLNMPGVLDVELISTDLPELSSIKTAPGGICHMDFGLLDFPLRATQWIEADRFTPLGMKGSKLLSDFFNDLKFDKIEKESQIVLRSSKNDIIWIAGKRLDERFKVSANTRQILKITFEYNK